MWMIGRSPSGGFLQAVVLALGVALWGGGCGVEDAGSSRGSPEEEGPGALAEAWLTAVAGDDRSGALEAAARLVETETLPEPPGFALELGALEGIGSGFFRGEFDAWDYQLWRDAYLMREIALAATAEGGGVGALFGAVTERVEGTEPSDLWLPWPRVIWERGYGLCDRQVWVLLELAYQVGWDGVVIYLYDPAREISPHTVGEVLGPDQVFFVDPFIGALQPGRSFEEVAGDPALLREMWPASQEIREAFGQTEFWLPVYAQDYRPRNQILQRKLRAELGSRTPRFGEDPAARYARTASLRLAGDRPVSSDPFRLWFYPFRLVRAQVFLQDPSTLEAWGRGDPGQGGSTNVR